MADAPGTCHLVGCPRKGEHPPHTFIGAGTWDDYTKPAHCLGFPEVEPYDLSPATALVAQCSVDEDAWDRIVGIPLTPQDMAVLVDAHRRDCTNRSAR